MRLSDGSALWVDAGELSVSALDEAIVRLNGGDRTGLVFVTPEQMLRAPEPIEGEIVGVRPREEEPEECRELPGSDMPPLGSSVEIGGAPGKVTALDPVRRRVTVRTPDGGALEVAVEEIALPD